MIDAGAAEGVDRVLGIHLWAPLQVGRVAVGPGPLFGSADEFGLVVRGRGGHGGMPHTSIDPVVCAAQIVTALQTVVSRETSPFDPAVVTIGRIEGGSAFNVIAEEVRLRGTVRAFEASERERLLQRIAELSAALAQSMRCEAEFVRANGCPPVVSDAEVAETVRRAAIATVGEESVDPAPRVTVGDDVALFLERAPGCYFLVGAGDVASHPVAPHHHPEFDIDERCLPVGTGVLARAALAELNAQ
jgi:amidohydrolase